MPTALLLVSLAQALPPLGPLDSAGLPPTELDRVRVGMVAPDLRLTDTTGAVHQGPAAGASSAWWSPPTGITRGARAL